MKHLFLFLTLSIFVFTPSIEAQEIKGYLDVKDPNQIHIIHTTTGDRLVGQINWISESELILAYKGNKLLFKRAELTKIEVQFKENEGTEEEIKSDIEILDNIPDLLKEEPQETSSPFSQYPFEVKGPLDLKDKNQKHKVILNDAKTFVGRIKILSAEKLTLRIDSKTIKSFEPSTIKVVEVISDKDPIEEITKTNTSKKDSLRLYILETKRGDRFVGQVIEYGKESVIFELENKTQLQFQNEEIEQIYAKEETSRRGVGLTYQPQEIPMSGAQNLFLTPTGFNYKAGQAEYKNLEIFYNSIDYGLTDNFSLGFGIIPLLVANVIDLKSKVTFDIGDYVHIGMGARLLAGITVFDDNWVLGALHGNVSVGTEEKFINFGYGKWLPINDDFVNIESDLYMIGGSFRISEKGRIFGDLIRVVENGEREFDQSDYSLVMLGGSWFNRKHRVDFGFFMVSTSGTDIGGPVIFPMAGYARTF